MSAQDYSPPADPRSWHGLRDNSPTANKQAYVDFRLAAYRYSPHWRNDTISEYYADDVHDFSVDDFKGINRGSRRGRRGFFRNRGAYVLKGRNFLMTDGLFAVVQEEILWPKLEDGDFT